MAAKKNIECKSARVDAVKAYAVEHYNEGGWDIVVEAYSDWDIYRVVKHQLSAAGALKKMAEHIAPKAEYREEIIALADNDTSVMYCEKCNAAVHSLDEMHDHVCQEEAPAVDPAAPNGYFKNGKPKPVAKAKLAQLIAAGLLS